MIANAYIVLATATHPRNGETSEHRLTMDAYTVQDAMMQALIELDGKFAFAEQGYKVKILSVAPDTQATKERVSALFEEIGWLRMPTTGGKS